MEKGKKKDEGKNCIDEKEAGEIEDGKSREEGGKGKGDREK